MAPLDSRTQLGVSVALCTHNGERFVERQIDSILAQSRLPDEVVLSDDHSTDNTVDLVKATFSRHLKRGHALPRLVLLENPVALGVARNFEQAIAAAGTELVALSDQDDIWRPDRIEAAVAQFADRPTLLLLHSDAQLIDEVGNQLAGTLLDALEVPRAVRQKIHAGEAFDELMKRNLVTGATTMFRRSLAGLAFPIPESWLHDEWLAIVAAAVDGVDLLPECLIDYRQHGDNQIGVHKLPITGKLRRIVESGFERNRRLLARASVLSDRFERMAVVPAERAQAARDKLQHETVRSSIPGSRLRRGPTVLRELRTGRYQRFGRGLADAFRDLVQPLKAAG